MANQELHHRQLRIGPMHAVSSAVAASKTETAYGRWASAIWYGTSAVPSIKPGFAFTLGSRRFNRDKLNNGMSQRWLWRHLREHGLKHGTLMTLACGQDDRDAGAFIATARMDFGGPAAPRAA